MSFQNATGIGCRVGLLAVLALLAISLSAQATTYLAGTLPSTLTQEGNPHIVLSDLSMTNGSACAIGPGVLVYFTENTGIIFNGATNVTCSGTEEEPIVFTGYQAATWKGLNCADGPNTPSHVFEYLEISAAVVGYRHHNFYSDCSIVFANCKVNGDGSGPGIAILNGPVYIDISDVDIENATDGLLIANIQGYSPSIQNCVARGCSRGFVLYSNYGVAITVSGIRAMENSSAGVTATELVNIASSEVRLNWIGIDFAGDFEGVGPSLVDCTVVENTVDGVVISGRGANVNNCRLYGNAGYDVRIVTALSSATTINCRNNDWGLATTNEMIAEGPFSNIEKIFDWWDDHSKSLVDYEGFINEASSAGDGTVEALSWGRIKGLFR